MRVESPSSPRERRSVSTVRRLIISMRDSNVIKKDEKYIPHFKRTELFSSGGGKPEGKEGEQYSPRDVHSISYLSTTQPAGRGVTILPCQRIALYPEGKEGEQHSPRDVHPIPRLSTPHSPRGWAGNTARRHSVRASSRVPLSNVSGRAKYAELCYSTKGLYGRRGWV